MTSEIGEMWNDIREMRKEKRADNRSSSAAILKDKNIPFEEKNEGAHLIVRYRERIIDFWPGTGLWIIRPLDDKKITTKQQRGVHRLLSFLERLPELKVDS